MDDINAFITEDVPDESWGVDDPRWKSYYDKREYYTGPIPTKFDTEPLPPEFGRNLDTLSKARTWLTNPHNWHSSNLFIIKWDGMNCTVNQERAIQLIREPWDVGLPGVVVAYQRRKRIKAVSGSLPGQEVDDKEAMEVLE